MSKCPAYYSWLGIGVEPRIIAEKLGYYVGNAFCYMVRHGRKPGEDAVKDLRKAISELEFRIADILAERGEAPAGPLEPPGVAAPAESPTPGGITLLAALESAWPCYQTKEGTWQAMSGVYFTQQGESEPPVAARWKCSPSKEKAIREAMKSVAKRGGYEGE